MTGLVFVEQLSLSWIQWTGLLCNVLVWLYQDIQWKWKWLFSTGILLTIFWNTPFSIDTKLTWDSLQRIQGYSIAQTFDMLGHLNYLKYQPPLWTVWLQWNPSYPWQQIYCFSIAGFIIALCHQRYGKISSSLIAATPLFALMSSHPSNDMYALCCLMITISTHHKLSKVSWFLLACCFKYTSIVMLPFIVFSFGWYVLIGFCLTGVYVWWSSQYFWGTIQGRYLLHSFSLGYISQYIWQASLSTHSTPPRPLYIKIFNTIRWRWTHVGQSALIALPFYLVPTYFQRWKWQAYLLGICLLLGYGNVKYFILLIPLFGEHYDSRLRKDF